MKRGSIALAAAVVLTGATLATASASSTPTKTATAATATTAVTTVSLLLPDAVGQPVSTNAYSYSGGLSSAGGKAQFSDLSVMRSVDSRTVLLTQRVADQKFLSKGVALVLTEAGRTQPVMKVTLGGVTVAGDSYSGSSGGSEESVAFHYTAIEVQYWTLSGTGTYTMAKSCWNTNSGTATCPTAVN